MAAAAALEARGWLGHVFVTTSRIGAPGFLTGTEIGELGARGHSIGSHSHTHPAAMRTLPAAEIEREWRMSMDALAEILGEPPRIAAVPGGSVSRTVVERAEAAGYRVLMTSRPSRRLAWEGAMLVVGRFAVWSTTSPPTIASYVTGAALPLARLRIGWTVKSVARRSSPRLYEMLRRSRADVR